MMKNRFLILTIFILLTGCSSISSRMQESDIESKLLTNGTYINKIALQDKKGVRINSVRFTKGKANKIKYVTEVQDKKGKRVSGSELVDTYRVSCHRERCQVRFSEYTKTMILDYKIDVSENGDLYLGSMDDKFIFKKDM